MTSGDLGKTHTLSGCKVRKDDCICQFCGDVDSVLAQIEKVNFIWNRAPLLPKNQNLDEIYSVLTNLCGNPYMKLNKEIVLELEKHLESVKTEITEFQRFTEIPAIEINELRVRVRRLERTFVSIQTNTPKEKNTLQYLNRLSSYLFYLAVYVEKNW